MADIMQDHFDAAMKKIGAINKPVSLFIEDGNKLKEEFEANGKKYIIVSPEHAFNLNRQRAYHDISTAFVMNQTPTSLKNRIVRNHNGLIRLFGRQKEQEWDSVFAKVLQDSYNNVDSYKGENTSRFPAAYYLATLFVIREGEDLAFWDWKAANEKIDDWVAANIRAADFLGLALASLKLSLETLTAD